MVEQLQRFDPRISPFAAGIYEHPQLVSFDSWGEPDVPPGLPQHAASWAAFWDGFDTADVRSAPVHG